MKTRTVRAPTMAACLALLAVVFESPVSTHHSFAMYDQTKVVTLTGVMKQFVPQANHAELHFILLAPDHKALAKGADGKYVEWGVEMAGTAAIAQQGITGTTFGRRHGVQRQAESAARRLELRRHGSAPSPSARWMRRPRSRSFPRPASTATRCRATR